MHTTISQAQDTDFVCDTVTTAIDAELLHKHADHTHTVSGASDHVILKQKLGDVDTGHKALQRWEVRLLWKMPAIALINVIERLS